MVCVGEGCIAHDVGFILSGYTFIVDWTCYDDLFKKIIIK